jgi:hypothetical protein
VPLFDVGGVESASGGGAGGRHWLGGESSDLHFLRDMGLICGGGDLQRLFVLICFENT